MATTIRTTTLDFGGIVCEVKLCKLTVRKDVALSRACKVEDGNGGAEFHEIGRVEIDKLTEEPVDPEAIVHGVLDGDEFRAITREALDALKEETRIEGITIDGFMPLKDVPFERVEGAYFLAPKGRGALAKPLAILARALQQTKRAGVTKFVLKERQYAGVIYALDGGLVLNTLSWASDFKQAREASEVLEGVQVEPQALALAKQLVETLAVGRDVLDGYEDDLIPLRESLVQEALAGKTPKRKGKKAAAEPTRDKLMEALEASLAAVQERDKASYRKAATAA